MVQVSNLFLFYDLEKKRWMAKGKEKAQDISRQQCTKGPSDWVCAVPE